MAGGGDAGDDGGDPPHACGEGPVGMLEVVGRVPVHRRVLALGYLYLPVGDAGTLFRCGLALSAGLSEDYRTLGTMGWATCSRSPSSIFANDNTRPTFVIAAPVRGC